MARITTGEVDGWIQEPIWVVYALDTAYVKKLSIAVGFRGFRVTHGKEIVYEGSNMANAIDFYNKISTAPSHREAPKLDN